MTTQDIRTGDRFLIEVEVVGAAAAGMWSCKLPASPDEGDGLYFTSALIAGKRLPRQIKVGDRVTWGDKIYSYEVLGIHDGEAWLANCLSVSDGEPARKYSIVQPVSSLVLTPDPTP